MRFHFFLPVSLNNICTMRVPLVQICLYLQSRKVFESFCSDYCFQRTPARRFSIPTSSSATGHNTSCSLSSVGSQTFIDTAMSCSVYFKWTEVPLIVEGWYRISAVLPLATVATPILPFALNEVRTKTNSLLVLSRYSMVESPKHLTSNKGSWEKGKANQHRIIDLVEIPNSHWNDLFMILTLYACATPDVPL